MKPPSVSLQLAGGERVDLSSLPVLVERHGLSMRSLRGAARDGRVRSAMVHGRLYIEDGTRLAEVRDAIHAWKEQSQTLRNPYRLRKRPDRAERKSVARKILAAMLAMGRPR